MNVIACVHAMRCTGVPRALSNKNRIFCRWQFRDVLNKILSVINGNSILLSIYDMKEIRGVIILTIIYGGMCV